MHIYLNYKKNNNGITKNMFMFLSVIFSPFIGIYSKVDPEISKLGGMIMAGYKFMGSGDCFDAT